MTIAPDQAALYTGRVTHTRISPFRHRLAYHVFSVFLDIDRIADTSTRTRLFSYNRLGFAAFYDKDHGDRSGRPLRPWVQTVLRDAGLQNVNGPIRLLCFPRIAGFVFNPLSLFFCYDDHEHLIAIVYEVHNTVGGTHAYVAPVSPSQRNAVIHQAADKVFYVSPFIEMTARYHFTVAAPAERFALTIRESGPDGPILAATHAGVRRPFDSRQLAWLLLAHPLMTVKVFGGILFEALFIWRKGARYHAPVPTLGPSVSRGWAITPQSLVPQQAAE